MWSVAIVFLSFLFVVSSTFLSDGVLTVNFTKNQDESDESNEYDFEYSLDDGKIFRNRTFLLDSDLTIYILFGANNTYYWSEFTESEYENQNTFSKIVRLVERNGDNLLFKDDFITYKITISTGHSLYATYATEWDLKKIRFCKSGNENQTFNYTISATNNSRKFNGTTLNEMNDPHVQRIHLIDDPQLNAVYEVNFSDNEIKTNEIFYKGISKHISGKLNETYISEVSLDADRTGADTLSNINPNLFKSLVG